MKTEHQKRIEKFMKLVGQEIPTRPMIPSPEVRILRAKLIYEEAVNETIVEGLGVDPRSFEIVRDANLEKIVDGCGDTSVVTIGTLSSCGVHDSPVLEEIDRSNLTKFEAPVCRNCKSILIWQGEGWKCINCGQLWPREVGGYRREDGKWIKPPYFQPPRIQQILDTQSDELTVGELISQRDKILRNDALWDREDDFNFVGHRFTPFNRANLREPGTWLQNHESWTNTKKWIIVSYSGDKVDIFSQEN